MKTTTASVLASMLAPFLMMLAPHGANSHAVEVVSCVTSENKLRIFVEHWHDWLSSLSDASFNFSVNGSSPQTMNPIGRVTSVSDTSQLPGCVSECTTLGSTCAGQTNCGSYGYYGSDCEGYDDWVWFDFEATDTVELVSSGGATLNPGCDGLYPVTISAATGTCATGCSCDELGQQCCIDGSPSEYEVCVNDADLNLVTITKETAPGTKCCVHTEDPLRIVQQHAFFNCPSE